MKVFKYSSTFQVAKEITCAISCIHLNAFWISIQKVKEKYLLSFLIFIKEENQQIEFLRNQK